tara:strand:+ start:1068 stop:1478 length:411 start_codon:yes stop_codon:yes gene_type:complete
MNINLFKDKKHNINKLMFFKMTPTYSTGCIKSIITHYITGNKLYEIMRNNRVSNLIWCNDYNFIYKYNIEKIPKRQNIIRKYTRIIPNKIYYYKTQLEKNGIEVLGNLKDRNKDAYLTNKKLKNICKNNGLHGYSN